MKQVMGRLQHQNLWGVRVVTHMGWLITAARSSGVGALRTRRQGSAPDTEAPLPHTSPPHAPRTSVAAASTRARRAQL